MWNSLCVIPVQYALIWRHVRIPSFKSACFRKYRLIRLQILKIKLKVSHLWRVTFRSSHSSPFVDYRFNISHASLFLWTITAPLTCCSSCLRIEHGTWFLLKSQQSGSTEAIRHWPTFPQYKQRKHTATPPSSPICQHEILMTLLLLGITYTCTSTLNWSQHANTDSSTPVHTPIHLPYNGAWHIQTLATLITNGACESYWKKKTKKISFWQVAEKAWRYFFSNQLNEQWK